MSVFVHVSPPSVDPFESLEREVLNELRKNNQALAQKVFPLGTPGTSPTKSSAGAELSSPNSGSNIRPCQQWSKNLPTAQSADSVLPYLSTHLDVLEAFDSMFSNLVNHPTSNPFDVVAEWLLSRTTDAGTSAAPQAVSNIGRIADGLDQPPDQCSASIPLWKQLWTDQLRSNPTLLINNIDDLHVYLFGPVITQLGFRRPFVEFMLYQCRTTYISRSQSPVQLPVKNGEVFPEFWFTGVYLYTVSNLDHRIIPASFGTYVQSPGEDPEWTPQIYQKMCKAMRDKNVTQLTLWAPLIDYIERSLEQLKLYQMADSTQQPNRWVVYRGIDIRIDKRRLYKLNSGVSWPAFSSTSVDGKIALEYMTKRSTGVGTFFIVYLPSAGAGYHVECCSAEQRERELLLAPGSNFRIVFVFPESILAMLGMTQDIVAMQLIADLTQVGQEAESIPLVSRLEAMKELSFIYEKLRRVYVPPSGRYGDKSPIENGADVCSAFETFALSDERVLTILGPAGIGKTSLLLYLVQYVYDNPKLKEGYVPIFLSLPSIPKVLETDHIVQAIQQTYAFTPENLDGLKREKVILFLDSLDEIPVDPAHPIREWKLFPSNHFSEWPHLKIVISCRDYYLPLMGVNVHHNFHSSDNDSKTGSGQSYLCSQCSRTILYLDPFNDEQRHKYIEKRVGNFLRDPEFQSSGNTIEEHANQKVGDLVKQLTMFPRDWVSTPFTLRMVVDILLDVYAKEHLAGLSVVDTQEGERPSEFTTGPKRTRYWLYTKWFQIHFANRLRRQPPEVQTEYSTCGFAKCFTFCEHLAYQLQRVGQTQMDYTKPSPDDTATTLLYECAPLRVVNGESDVDNISFYHKTLQEYLMARYIATHPAIDHGLDITTELVILQFFGEGFVPNLHATRRVNPEKPYEVGFSELTPCLQCQPSEEPPKQYWWEKYQNPKNPDATKQKKEEQTVNLNLPQRDLEAQFGHFLTQNRHILGGGSDSLSNVGGVVRALLNRILQSRPGVNSSMRILKPKDLEPHRTKKVRLAATSITLLNAAGLSFSGLDFESVCLHGASLQGANLAGVNFRNADLSHADLRDSILDDSILEGADLSGALVGDLVRSISGHEHGVWGICSTQKHHKSDHLPEVFPRLVSCSDDGTVGFCGPTEWDLSSTSPSCASASMKMSACGRKIVEKGVEIRAMCMAPDGAHVATGNDKGMIFIWDTITGTIVASYQAHERTIFSLCWTSTNLLVSGPMEPPANVWKIDLASLGIDSNLEPVFELLGSAEYIRTVAATSDAKKLLTGCDDKSVRIYAMEAISDSSVHGTVEPSAQFCQHQAGIWAIVVARNDLLVASGDALGGLLLWNLSTLVVQQRIAAAHNGRCHALCWKPEPEPNSLAPRNSSESPETFLISGGEDGAIRIWDATSGDNVHVIMGHTRGITSICCFMGQETAPAQGAKPEKGPPIDPVVIVSASLDHTIRLSSIISRPRIRDIHHCKASHWDAVDTVSCSSSADVIVSASGFDSKVIAWKPNGEAMFAVQSENVGVVCFAPNGYLLATQSYGDCLLWDVRTGVLLTTLQSGSHPDATCFAFSTDSTLLLVGSKDKTVKVWDLIANDKMGKCLYSFKEHYTHPVTSVGLVGYDRPALVAVSADANPQGCILKWQLNLNSIASPDGDFEQLVCQQLIGHSGQVTCLQVSADGAFLFSCATDGLARKWDLATNVPVMEYRIPSLAPRVPPRISVSSNGQLLAVLSCEGKDPKTAKGLVTIYSTSTGETLAIIERKCALYDVDFGRGPFSPYLVLALANKTAEKWAIDLQTGKTSGAMLTLGTTATSSFGAAVQPPSDKTKSSANQAETNLRAQLRAAGAVESEL